MHATWHALQPMQLDTSMSLATSWTAERACGLGSVVAERAAMSSDWSDDISGLLDVDDERLVFGGLRVRIAHERRQRVDQITRLRQTHETPVVRQPYRVDLPAVAFELRDAFGHHGHAFDVATVRRHLDHVSVGDALGLGELLADLHELLRLDDRGGQD